MINKKQNYLFLALWSALLIVISFIIGYTTKPEISDWYSLLSRSPLTPPNYVFPIVWTLLYTAIGASGFFIWQAQHILNIEYIKILYTVQLLLNWSWTPLFFSYHLVGWALITLICMDLLVAAILYATHKTLKKVFALMLPYAIWLLFATYLTFYIWIYN